MSAGDDGRRAEPRVTINQEFDSFEAFAREYVANISRSGAFIKCDPPLAVGTPVAVRFAVLAGEGGTVEAAGEVVRVQADPPGVGVVFTQLEPRSLELIEALLRER
jgi:hypothetical protein